MRREENRRDLYTGREEERRREEKKLVHGNKKPTMTCILVYENNDQIMTINY